MDYTLIAVAVLSFCVGYWTCYLVGKYLTKEIVEEKPKTKKPRKKKEEPQEEEAVLLPPEETA